MRRSERKIRSKSTLNSCFYSCFPFRKQIPTVNFEPAPSVRHILLFPFLPFLIWLLLFPYFASKSLRATLLDWRPVRVTSCFSRSPHISFFSKAVGWPTLRPAVASHPVALNFHEFVSQNGSILNESYFSSQNGSTLGTMVSASRPLHLAPELPTLFLKTSGQCVKFLLIHPSIWLASASHPRWLMNIESQGHLYSYNQSPKN